MNSRLERARSFLLGRCKSTALRVLPLALLAMGSMQAASVTISNANVTQGFGSIFALTNLTDGLVKFSGNGSCGFSSITSTCVLEFDFQVQHNQGPTVQLDYDLLVYSFAGDISLDISNGASTLYWSTLIPQGDPTADGAMGIEVNNGTVRFRFESEFLGDGFSVEIPGNSIDFSPGQAPVSTVPEPGTMAMALAGAAALAVARRRRK